MQDEWDGRNIFFKSMMSTGLGSTKEIKNIFRDKRKNTLSSRGEGGERVTMHCQIISARQKSGTSQRRA